MKLKEELQFIDVTARMALRADASNLILGYLWWLLEPLLFVGIFYLVFAVILDSPRADFLSFLVVAKLPFQWFSGGVNTSANAISGAKLLIANTSVPKSLLSLSKLHQATYKQIVVFVLLGIYLIIMGRPPSTAWIWVLPIAVTQYLVTAVFAMAGSIAVCFARDFSKLIQLFTIFVMFASGIFWDIRALDPSMQTLIFLCNPIAFLLDAYRQVLLYGEFFDVSRLCLIFGVSAAVCALLIRWVERNETMLALRVMSQ